MAIADLKRELQELEDLFFLAKTKAAGGTGSGSEDEFRKLMNEETQVFKVEGKKLKIEIQRRATDAPEKKINAFVNEVISAAKTYFSSKPTTKNVKFEMKTITDGVEVIVKVIDENKRGRTGKKTDLFAALQKFKSDEVNKIAEKYPEVFGKKEEGNIFTKTNKKSGAYWNILDIGHDDAVAAGKAASVKGTLTAGDSEINDLKQELIKDFEESVETQNSLQLEHFQDIIDSGGKLELSDKFVVMSSLEDSVENQVEKGGKKEAKVGKDLATFLKKAQEKLAKEYGDPKTSVKRKRSTSIEELALQMIINNKVMRGLYTKGIAKNLTNIKKAPKSKKKDTVKSSEKLKKRKIRIEGIVLTSLVKNPAKTTKTGNLESGMGNNLMQKAFETRAFVNSRLSKTIQGNMGRPSLINQTGRFADSAQVTNAMAVGNQIHMDYSYNNAYRVFEDSRDYPAGFDPRPLIERSIRELAAARLETKFTLRRV
jgi:hypothetical protein